jgi:hypothetical protein
MGGPLVVQDDPRLAAWTSGVILASRARGPGVNSRSSPSQPREENSTRHCAKMDTSCAETRDRTIAAVAKGKAPLRPWTKPGVQCSVTALRAAGQVQVPGQTECRLAFRRPSPLGGGWTKATVSARKRLQAKAGHDRKGVAPCVASKAQLRPAFGPRPAASTRSTKNASRARDGPANVPTARLKPATTRASSSAD